MERNEEIKLTTDGDFTPRVIAFHAGKNASWDIAERPARKMQVRKGDGYYAFRLYGVEYEIYNHLAIVREFDALTKALKEEYQFYMNTAWPESNGGGVLSITVDDMVNILSQTVLGLMGGRQIMDFAYYVGDSRYRQGWKDKADQVVKDFAGIMSTEPPVPE